MSIINIFPVLRPVVQKETVGLKEKLLFAFEGLLIFLRIQLELRGHYFNLQKITQPLKLRNRKIIFRFSVEHRFDICYYYKRSEVPN
jgi:hypothetical protein